MMLVPHPAPVSICSFPPSFATRARIFAIPKPLLCSRRFLVVPDPLSVTWSIRFGVFQRKVVVMTVGLA